MHTSIRNRLLIFLLTLVPLAWLLSAIIGYFDIRHKAEELFDAQLMQSARLIIAVSRHEMAENHSFSVISRIFSYGAGDRNFIMEASGRQYFAYQIWILPHKLVARSDHAPDQRLSHVEKGFSFQIIDDHRWRVFSVYDQDKTIMVQVGGRYDTRQHAANAVAFKMMIPFFIFLPTLGIFIWFGVGRALRPLDRLADQVSSRNPGHLDPIPSTNIPQEVAPLVSSMNNLFERLARAFENERQFTSNAAHELRTPLAGLKAQAQLALRAKDEEVGQKALTRLIEGVDRSSHLVTQMLTLARLDPETDELRKENVLLSEILSNVLEEIVPLALEKEIDFTLDKNEPLWIRGDKYSLSILIRNLTDNAIRYTPRGGEVKIGLEKKRTCAFLRFDDSGPGIPETAYEKVFERFYRHLGTTEPGSGLGLSIAGKIARLHDAKLDLKKSDMGGLQVTLEIPLSL